MSDPGEPLLSPAEALSQLDVPFQTLLTKHNLQLFAPHILNLGYDTELCEFRDVIKVQTQQAFRDIFLAEKIKIGLIDKFWAKLITFYPESEQKALEIHFSPVKIVENHSLVIEPMQVSDELLHSASPSPPQAATPAATPLHASYSETTCPIQSASPLSEPIPSAAFDAEPELPTKPPFRITDLVPPKTLSRLCSWCKTQDKLGKLRLVHSDFDNAIERSEAWDSVKRVIFHCTADEGYSDSKLTSHKAKSHRSVHFLYDGAAIKPDPVEFKDFFAKMVKLRHFEISGRICFNVDEQNLIMDELHKSRRNLKTVKYNGHFECVVWPDEIQRRRQMRTEFWLPIWTELYPNQSIIHKLTVSDNGEDDFFELTNKLLKVKGFEELFFLVNDADAFIASEWTQILDCLKDKSIPKMEISTMLLEKCLTHSKSYASEIVNQLKPNSLQNLMLRFGGEFDEKFKFQSLGEFFQNVRPQQLSKLQVFASESVELKKSYNNTLKVYRTLSTAFEKMPRLRTLLWEPSRSDQVFCKLQLQPFLNLVGLLLEQTKKNAARCDKTQFRLHNIYTPWDFPFSVVKQHLAQMYPPQEYEIVVEQRHGCPNLLIKHRQSRKRMEFFIQALGYD